jgi:hypothetical protein
MLKEIGDVLQRPEYYRLPRQGSGGDPYFHLSRSFYFRGEALGYWRLTRICEPGKSRGVTLVCYDEIARFIAKQREQQQNGGDK